MIATGSRSPALGGAAPQHLRDWKLILKTLHRCYWTADRICHSDHTGFKFHFILQKLVVRAAKDSELDGMKEFPVPDRGDGRRGYIDAAWSGKDGIADIIEIDSSYREKSIRKLQMTDAPAKFWLYYGRYDSYFVNNIPTGMWILVEPAGVCIHT